MKGKSIISHAERHVGRHLVFTIDIENFYPSTKKELVVASLSHGLPEHVARLIAGMCAYEGGLPQGSPASMFLANVAFRTADKKFHRFCRKHRLKYSRYVDDLAISGDYDFRSFEGAFTDIITSLGYKINRNPKKTGPFFRHRRQIITGLLVNDRLEPTREYKKEIKQTIRNCIELCPEGLQMIADEMGLSIRTLKNRLTGQARFVEQFNPRLGKQLRGLLCHLWRLHSSLAATPA